MAIFRQNNVWRKTLHTSVGAGDEKYRFRPLLRIEIPGDQKQWRPISCFSNGRWEERAQLMLHHVTVIRDGRCETVQLMLLKTVILSDGILLLSFSVRLVTSAAAQWEFWAIRPRLSSALALAVGAKNESFQNPDKQEQVFDYCFF